MLNALLNRAQKWLGRHVEQYPGGFRYWPDGLGGRSEIPVNGSTALMYAPLWRAINLISGDIARVPLFVYRREGETGRRPARLHPAWRVVKRRPNPDMTPYVFWQTLTYHVLVYGNGYAFISRDRAGRPMELWPLEPEATTPVRADGQLWYTTTTDQELRRIAPENVLHIKGLSYNGLTGFSLLDKARESLGLGLTQEAYGLQYFRSNGNPSVAIVAPGKLTEEGVNNIKRRWREAHEGLDKAHHVAVLHGGHDVKQLNINAADSQLVESRKFSIIDVSNWTGVPPHKLGDDARTSYSSLESENQSYVDSALDRWMVAIEQECDAKLISPREQAADSTFCEFRRQALVRANLESRISAYRVGIEAGLYSINEVRALENLDNLGPEGNEHRLPMNYTNLKALLAPDDQAAAALTETARSLLRDQVRRYTVRVLFAARRKAGKPEELTRYAAELHEREAPPFMDRTRAICQALAVCAGHEQDRSADLAAWFVRSLAERLETEICAGGDLAEQLTTLAENGYATELAAEAVTIVEALPCGKPD